MSQERSILYILRLPPHSLSERGLGYKTECVFIGCSRLQCLYLGTSGTLHRNDGIEVFQCRDHECSKYSKFVLLVCLPTKIPDQKLHLATVTEDSRKRRRTGRCVCVSSPTNRFLSIGTASFAFDVKSVPRNHQTPQEPRRCLPVWVLRTLSFRPVIESQRQLIHHRLTVSRSLRTREKLPSHQ
jgi:hypothetical protein